MGESQSCNTKVMVTSNITLTPTSVKNLQYIIDINFIL